MRHMLEIAFSIDCRKRFSCNLVQTRVWTRNSFHIKDFVLTCSWTGIFKFFHGISFVVVNRNFYPNGTVDVNCNILLLSE